MIPYHNSARLIWRTVHDFIIFIRVLYGHEPRKFDILLHVFECFCFWQRHHITVNLWSACGAAGSSSCTRDLASCSSSCLSLRPNWASATMKVTYLEPEAPSTASSVIVKVLGARGKLAFCTSVGHMVLPSKKVLSVPPTVSYLNFAIYVSKSSAVFWGIWPWLPKGFSFEGSSNCSPATAIALGPSAIGFGMRQLFGQMQFSSVHLSWAPGSRTLECSPKIWSATSNGTQKCQRSVMLDLLDSMTSNFTKLWAPSCKSVSSDCASSGRSAQPCHKCGNLDPNCKLAPLNYDHHLPKRNFHRPNLPIMGVSRSKTWLHSPKHHHNQHQVSWDQFKRRFWVDKGQDLKISHFPSAQDTQSRTWYCAVSTADAREGLPHGYEWRLAVKSDVERLKGYTLTSYWQMSIHFKKYHTLAVDEVDDDSIDLVELSSLQQPKLQFIPGGLPMYEMQAGPVPEFMTAFARVGLWGVEKGGSLYKKSKQQQQQLLNWETARSSSCWDKKVPKKHLNIGI